MTDATKGFTLTREFLASPQQVWDAWTNPDTATLWLHPRGFTTPRETITLDAHVGARYSYTMVSDVSGEEIVTEGVFREVFENQRLVFTWGDTDDPMLITVEIEEFGDLTKLDFDLRGYEGMSGDDYIYDGWEQAIDNLAAHLMGSQPIG